MKACEKWDLGVPLTIHKMRMDYRNTETFKFLCHNLTLSQVVNH